MNYNIYIFNNDGVVMTESIHNRFNDSYENASIALEEFEMVKKEITPSPSPLLHKIYHKALKKAQNALDNLTQNKRNLHIAKKVTNSHNELFTKIVMKFSIICMARLL